MERSSLGSALFVPGQDRPVLERALKQQSLDIARAEMEQRDRALKVHSGAQELKAMEMAWDQSPPGSRQRIAVQNKLLAMQNINPDEIGVSPQDLEKLTGSLITALRKDKSEFTTNRLSEPELIARSAQRLALFEESLTQPGLASVVRQDEALGASAREKIDATMARPGYDARDREVLNRLNADQYKTQSGVLAHGAETAQSTAGQIDVQAEKDRLIRERAKDGIATGRAGALTPADRRAAAILQLVREGIRSDRAAKTGTQTKETKGVGGMTFTETIPVAEAPTKARLAELTQQAMAIVDQAYDAPTRGKPASVKRDHGKARREAASRVAAGQPVAQAALGAVEEVAGPGKAYGTLPPPLATTPEAFKESLSDLLELWSAAHPGVSGVAARDFVAELLEGGGYVEGGRVKDPFRQIVNDLLTGAPQE